jgi:hypothetical protein
LCGVITPSRPRSPFLSRRAALPNTEAVCNLRAALDVFHELEGVWARVLDSGLTRADSAGFPTDAFAPSAAVYLVPATAAVTAGRVMEAACLRVEQADFFYEFKVLDILREMTAGSGDAATLAAAAVGMNTGRLQEVLGSPRHRAHAKALDALDQIRRLVLGVRDGFAAAGGAPAAVAAALAGTAAAASSSAASASAPWPPAAVTLGTQCTAAALTSCIAAALPAADVLRHFAGVAAWVRAQAAYGAAAVAEGADDADDDRSSVASHGASVATAPMPAPAEAQDVEWAVTAVAGINVTALLTARATARAVEARPALRPLLCPPTARPAEGWTMAALLGVTGPSENAAHAGHAAEVALPAAAADACAEDVATASLLATTAADRASAAGVGACIAVAAAVAATLASSDKEAANFQQLVTVSEQALACARAALAVAAKAAA